MSFPKPSEAVLAQAEQLHVSRESWLRIEQFVDLLLTWQARINLISPASIPFVWERHVMDSLQVLPLVPASTIRVADLGSGSGLPALPLAIASGLEFHLYESNNKKAAFLREAMRVTGCKGEVHPERLEGSAACNGAGLGVFGRTPDIGRTSHEKWCTSLVSQGARCRSRIDPGAKILENPIH
jgi:16S rRNA (guanine527-N7)-methyltransferase